MYCVIYSIINTAGKIKIWLELQDMLAWILTLALVCVSSRFFIDLVWWVVKFHLIDTSAFWWLVHRAKSKRWFRISWLCFDVLLERKVIITIYLYFGSCQHYVLLFDLCFLCSLPWQGLKAGTKKQKYEKISEKKVSTSIEVSWIIIILF